MYGLLFTDWWFLSELKPWLGVKDRSNLAVAGREFWWHFEKKYSTIEIKLCKRKGWAKQRPSFFDSKEIVRIVITPLQPNSSLEYHGNTGRRTIQQLVNYWLPNHPNLKTIMFIHNYNPVINLSAFINVIDLAMRRFGFECNQQLFYTIWTR